MERIKEKVSSPKGRRFLYVIGIAVLLGWVVFRFTAIGAEKSLYVFNAARVAADVGAPVEAISVSKREGILKEPIGIKNNRAYVSGARIANLHVGQKVGDGQIISVSKNIDLDSGMHVVKTRGVADGLQYAEFVETGYFVPLYAINNGVVFIAENGVATPRNVNIVRQDSDTALISEGLQDGDLVILSKVNSGDKVQVK